MIGGTMALAPWWKNLLGCRAMLEFYSLYYPLTSFPYQRLWQVGLSSLRELRYD